MARVRSAASLATTAAASAATLEPEPVSSAPLDVTAETDSDGVASTSDRAVQRAELLVVARRLKDQDRQDDIDRIHAEFDANAAERAEYQRQMNVLRDMAMEQQKHDDEILKKWIALI